jgi:malate dehydrogenase (oxaloacetate-decarboxylating)
MAIDYYKESLKLHKEKKGKLEICPKIKVESKEDLSLAYTPGVAEPCREIAKNKELSYELTSSKNTVAVISDGSAVLGLGNIGPEAGLPVMEGKSLLFKEFANVDSFPIVLNTQDTEEIIKTIKNIAPTFGGINLEDISAPRCFEIEKRLKEELDIPVFHDDQHGTAIVVLAGLINALKLANKNKEEIKIVVNGAGAAGIAITKLLHKYGVKNIIVCDSKGIISKDRDNLNEIKKEILKITNLENEKGTVHDALKNADVFIGVSKGNLLNEVDVKNMNEKPIIFAMANPTPEIMPDLAKKAGVFIIATGRSDFPNQINNVLVFPGIFKGAMKIRTQITDEIKLNVAEALANYVENPTTENIIPNPLDKNVANVVATTVINTVKK